MRVRGYEKKKKNDSTDNVVITVMETKYECDVFKDRKKPNQKIFVCKYYYRLMISSNTNHSVHWYITFYTNSFFFFSFFFSLISGRAFRSIWYAEINGLSNSGNANYRYYPAARRAKKFSAAGTGKKLSAEPRESRRSLFSPYFFRRRFRFILPIVKILRLGNRVLQRIREKYCPIPQTKREWITRIS